MTLSLGFNPIAKDNHLSLSGLLAHKLPVHFGAQRSEEQKKAGFQSWFVMDLINEKMHGLLLLLPTLHIAVQCICILHTVPMRWGKVMLEFGFCGYCGFAVSDENERREAPKAQYFYGRLPKLWMASPNCCVIHTSIRATTVRTYMK